ncbi:DeoR/GlpR family DNA-binding transcription regulator [Photobacterium satsumensis]|uniref:DeoR/GlpR family DNA-binding transcription regulator n=1 Tax=Photobacterium satsumensis TaxID=2910239 RepID=UPI003D118BF3
MNVRTNRIIDYINDSGRASVAELSSELNVSVETIRRDLKHLDAIGYLVRVHGGAVSKKNNDVGTSFNNRVKSNVEVKQNLVDKIIPQLFEGAVIGLDASSSCWHFAQSMPNISCTVVTNSLNVINALKGKDKVNIIGLGGNYSEKYEAFYGVLAKNMLDGISLDLCLISCVGFDFTHGVWDSNEYNYEIKRKLIDISEQVILIADKSKLHKRSLLKICDAVEVDIVVTDVILGSDKKREIENSNNLLIINN